MPQYFGQLAIAIVQNDGTVLFNSAARALIARDPEGGRLLLQMFEDGGAPDVAEDAIAVLETLSTVYHLRLAQLDAVDAAGAPAIMIIIEDESDRDYTNRLMHKFKLTRREVEVALLLLDRQATDEISRQLSISWHTTRHHVKHILAKLGVRTRAAARAALMHLRDAPN